MSATLISRNADLAKLEADGLRLQLVQGTAHHLLIEGVPAVTSKSEVVEGVLYCPLELDPDEKTKNPVPNHQCWWIGEPPCDASGRMMTEMISNNSAEDRGDEIRTTVAFSRKRADKKPYADLYEKIWAYLELIWHEARVIDPTCDPLSARPVPAVVKASQKVFRYPDMATTRAGIGAATAKLLAKRIAIIGLGGTGSYILDLLAKIAIAEIHLYDGDDFDLHNAFRSPAAPALEQLTKPKKVDWFFRLYDPMHSGIKPHPKYVLPEEIQSFSDFDFVFVAIDDGEARKAILQGLLAIGVPFIDTGIDLDFDDTGALRGMIRCTVGTPQLSVVRTFGATCGVD